MTYLHSYLLTMTVAGVKYRDILSNLDMLDSYMREEVLAYFDSDIVTTLQLNRIGFEPSFNEVIKDSDNDAIVCDMSVIKEDDKNVIQIELNKSGSKYLDLTDCKNLARAVYSNYVTDALDIQKVKLIDYEDNEVHTFNRLELL